MERLLTVPEAAELIKVSESTIRRHCRQGLPHIKKSFGIRFRQKDLEKWLEKDKRKSILVDNILRNALTNLPPPAIDKAKGGKEVARATKSRHNYGYGAVYIRRTKKGHHRYYIDYHDRTGKRTQKLIKNALSLQEAHEALKNAVLKEHYKECGIKEQKQPIKFKEFAQLYIEDYAKIAKKSWETDEYRLRRLKAFFKDIELREIRPLLIQKFRDYRIKAGVSKITTNREIALLKKMFNIAAEEGYVEQNPAKKIKLFSEMDSVRDRVLDEEEEPKLFEALSDHMKPFVLTALHTGMRVGEILNLKWNNVNLDKEWIKVEKTKSKKVRFIPITSLLLDELKRLKLKEGKEPLVFPFKSVRTAFENACKRAGIEDFTFHDLRRTFGTRLLEEGANIVRISKFYGHSSVLVTQRYLHPKDELNKETVELLVKKPKEKKKDLLHQRYAKKEEEFEKLSIVSFSMN